MTNLIRSDFYKLFRTKAFYFCGIIAALLSSLGVVLLNSAINSELGISASLLGYDGVYALITGTGQATLFVTIMISMFVPNEFSFGTIKNIVSKGVSYEEVKELIDSVMNEAFYTMLLGLDGETSLGDVQMQYKVYDENDNLLDGIESYAYDVFMDEE